VLVESCHNPEASLLECKENEKHKTQNRKVKNKRKDAVKRGERSGEKE
jgi:hypothetical protein